MKIAILTMFNGLSSTYSLVNVVSSHIKMMLDNNEEVTMVVTSLLQDSEKYGIFLDERINWIYIDNTLNGKNIIWHDYSSNIGNVHGSFFEEVSHYKKEFVEKLNIFDVIFMHDILYQGWHLVHNVAMREALLVLKDIRVIEFTHSLPTPRPNVLEYPFSERFSPLKNTIFAYPTSSGLEALSKQYNVPIENCKAIGNCLTILEDLHPSVQSLSTHTDLLSPDILVIYPARLTTGKRFEKVVTLLGAIKKGTNKSVKVIFTDFKSTDIDQNIYKQQIIFQGTKSGLDEKDIVFTSDCGFPDGFPREGVLDLFTLSNLYICPSFSESFGLTVIEAGSRGNFIVVNQKVPALAELGKNLDLYFMNWDALNFGFITTETYHPDEEAYNIENGQNIVNLMQNDKSLMIKTKIRQKYSTDYIWENQLKPILYEKGL